MPVQLRSGMASLRRYAFVNRAIRAYNFGVIPMRSLHFRSNCLRLKQAREEIFR
jgi:hypothetical protein